MLKRIAAAGEGACVPANEFLPAGSESAGEQMRLIKQREILDEVEPGEYRFHIELVRRWFAR